MKKYSFIVFQVLFLILVFTSGCALTHTERKLDEKLSQDSFAKSWSELNDRVNKLLDSSQHLSDHQKLKLIALYEKSREASERFSLESLRLRTALMEDLISSQYDPDEIDLILDKFKKLQTQRFAAIFEAVSETNNLLGRSPASQFSKDIYNNPYLSKQD